MDVCARVVVRILLLMSLMFKILNRLWTMTLSIQIWFAYKKYTISISNIINIYIPKCNLSNKLCTNKRISYIFISIFFDLDYRIKSKQTEPNRCENELTYHTTPFRIISFATYFMGNFVYLVLSLLCGWEFFFIRSSWPNLTVINR